MTLYFPYVDIYIGSPYLDGTCTLTNGSATVGGVTWNSNMDGGLVCFDIDDVGSAHMINFVNSGASETLTSKWSGETVSGATYMADNPSAGNYRLRIYPTLRQTSGSSGSIMIELPLEGETAVTSVMPMQNTKKLYHVDGYIYIDSCNKPGVDTVSELLAEIEAMSNKLVILGLRWYNKNYTGNTGIGVTLEKWTLKDQYKPRSFGVDKWKAKIQMDLVLSTEL